MVEGARESNDGSLKRAHVHCVLRAHNVNAHTPVIMHNLVVLFAFFLWNTLHPLLGSKRQSNGALGLVEPRAAKFPGGIGVRPSARHSEASQVNSFVRRTGAFSLSVT